MSPPPKQDFPDDGDAAFGDPARRLRDTIAPGTIGDPHDDMSDFPLIRDAGEKPRANRTGVRLDDFYAYMPMHSYIYAPTRELWPASSVNARVAPPAKGIKTNLWLDQHRPVEQMTWAPGSPMLIANRLISEGGWIERNGVTCFNLYRQPTIKPGTAAKAEPRLDHVSKVFGDDADHIVKWLAHRVQRPADKINHALVLGGAQGIGKDTLLEPVKHAVGPWNFHEVSPQHMLGRFNGFLKSVILRVSEARDLGDIDRFQAYFDGALRPLPLVITNTLPFGKRIAFCSYNPSATGRTITLNVPKDHNTLVADNDTLLHEMVHQSLFERGEDAAHLSKGWRREIMRITKLITGTEIWAGPSVVRRIDGRATRFNAPNPETGQQSLTQAVIARWPHDELGINLGALGEVQHVAVCCDQSGQCSQ